jgi:tetratricopeptide (TPR) repeat protein
MKECPQCGNAYPDSFAYCPADGSALDGDGDEGERKDAVEPAQIKVKTLVIGFAVLVLCSLIVFMGVFFYLYWKPKYGNLKVVTTPPGAMIYVDGKQRGVSPVTLSSLRSGEHHLKGAKEGYEEYAQQVMVRPYTTENLHWELEPLIPQLTNEQLAEVESLREKLENAKKEDILLPAEGPDDYNVLYFADRILSIDPANSYAMEIKNDLGERERHLAELAYAREDWLECEKHYKNYALIFPDDAFIEERLSDVAAKIDESIKDRERRIREWRIRAQNAMKAGNLVPPDKNNALDAIRSIQRLDKDNAYVREALSHLRELMQNRGDRRIAASDWQGARSDFRLLLQYFPDDAYSKSRLELVEAKLSELAKLEKARIQQANEEQQSRQKKSLLRQTALNSFDAGLYEKSISEWKEYLKFEPDSDEAYLYIGAGYQNQKQLDTAILNFEKALSLNPDNVAAHLNLGRIYDYHRNDLKTAAEHLERARELGGAGDYTPGRLQSMIRDLEDRMQADLILRQPFPVEHKHTFSSCRGNLIFTEEGLEYRTLETDHSFYEAYDGLREFKLKGDKLSLRTRNNKKYNFTFLKAEDAARIRTWNASSHAIPIAIEEDGY